MAQIHKIKQWKVGMRSPIQGPIVKLSCFFIELQESVNVIKKYGFVESSNGEFRNGFTLLRKLGKHRYLISHKVSKSWHVTNIEDAEIFVKNFLRLDGYM